MNDYINRASLINNLNTFALEHYNSLVNDLILKEPAANVVEIPKTGFGDLSDGYHTFNDLYFQRCMLFEQIVHDHKDRAWKTRFHKDGEPCFGGGWFLVAIDTPNGAYGYHYEDKYWDLFDCEELPRAKHWDGYTEKDVDRLLSLPDVVERKRGKWEYKPSLYPYGVEHFECSLCGESVVDRTNFCPNCGADMREES